MEKTEVRKTMGARIREMRLAAGMSQEQLAEALCTKKCTVSAYENDRIDIKSSIVLEIAKVLNCTGSYLLEGEQCMGTDDRIRILLSKIGNEQVKEIALKQLEALTLLGWSIVNILFVYSLGNDFCPMLIYNLSCKEE